MICNKRLKPSRLKLGYRFLIFLALLLIAGNLSRFGWQNQWSGWEDFSWIEQRGENLTVISIIPEYNKQVKWLVPGNTLIEAADGYGEYQWKNIYELGRLDDRGGWLLARSSQKALGLKISGWKVGKDSNLSWWDKCRLWYWESFKIKQRREIDLSTSGALSALVLNDNTPVYMPESHRLDQLVNQETFSQSIADEGLSLAFINGADLIRVVSNHGYDLVSTVFGGGEAELPLIWVNDKQLLDSRSVRWPKQLLPQAKIKFPGRDDQWTAVVVDAGRGYN